MNWRKNWRPKSASEFSRRVRIRIRIRSRIAATAVHSEFLTPSSCPAIHSHGRLFVAIHYLLHRSTVFSTAGSFGWKWRCSRSPKESEKEVPGALHERSQRNFLGCTPRGSCNRTLLRRVLRRFFKGSAS